MKNYRGIDYSSIYETGYCVANYDSHSMGDSLKKYIEMKLPDILFSDKISEIHVVGNYNRNQGVSLKEKNDKLFNYKRPTVMLEDHVGLVNCYPGVDYVYHYASLIKTYLNILESDKKLKVNFPSEQDIEQQLMKSNLKDIPKCKTVILGYVVGFDYLSNDNNWKGNGDFLWKSIDNSKILLGCKHSYWGDIAGHIVSILAKQGVKNVIYIGKLGTLNKNNNPNETIATGSKSIFLDGSSIEWDNLFDNERNSLIKTGIHYTLPSIIQETKQWVEENENKVDFVDPEIGHMAKAAQDNGIYFSYMHIISDNLSKKFDEDLSNERKQEILVKRKKLIRTNWYLYRKDLKK